MTSTKILTTDTIVMIATIVNNLIIDMTTSNKHSIATNMPALDKLKLTVATHIKSFVAFGVKTEDNISLETAVNKSHNSNVITCYCHD